MTRTSIIQQIFLDAFRAPLMPAHRPDPASWMDEAITGSCLGHSTVLMNFLGTWMLTDPVFSERVGPGIGPLIFGPKRHLRPALGIDELPHPDLIVLSHAHFDHLDVRSLKRFPRETRIVTAAGTADLLGHFDHVTELAWGEHATIAGVSITALQVNHWGARMLRDDHRGYNGYLLEKCGRRICFAGDTAMTDAFAHLGQNGAAPDLILMPIGAYDPWIRSHCNPEQAREMARSASAKYFAPVHHQTFQLSAEPMDEPGRRIRSAFSGEREQLLVVEVGETFRLPET